MIDWYCVLCGHTDEPFDGGHVCERCRVAPIERRAPHGQGILTAIAICLPIYGLLAWAWLA